METPNPTPLTRSHARRLREVYRSAGWPYQDTLEVELLSAGLLCRVIAASGKVVGLCISPTGSNR